MVGFNRQCRHLHRWFWWCQPHRRRHHRDFLLKKLPSTRETLIRFDAFPCLSFFQSQFLRRFISIKKSVSSSRNITTVLHSSGRSPTFRANACNSMHEILAIALLSMKSVIRQRKRHQNWQIRTFWACQ